jgi:hypothetical protein
LLYHLHPCRRPSGRGLGRGDKTGKLIYIPSSWPSPGGRRDSLLFYEQPRITFHFIRATTRSETRVSADQTALATTEAS